jgi:hypothetical protein
MSASLPTQRGRCWPSRRSDFDGDIRCAPAARRGGTIDTSRRTVGYRGRADDRRPLRLGRHGRLPFRLVVCETERFPTGSVRQLWDPGALARNCSLNSMTPRSGREKLHYLTVSGSSTGLIPLPYAARSVRLPAPCWMVRSPSSQGHIVLPFSRLMPSCPNSTQISRSSRESTQHTRRCRQPTAVSIGHPRNYCSDIRKSLAPRLKRGKGLHRIAKSWSTASSDDRQSIDVTLPLAK